MLEADPPNSFTNRWRRNDIPWADIRAAYESGNTNFSELSRRFSNDPHLKRQTIARRVRAERWTVDGTIRAGVEAQARAKVIDMATRRVIEKAGGDAAIDARATAIAAELQMQSAIASKLTQASEEVFDMFLAGEIKPSHRQNEADVLRSLVAAVFECFRAARLIHGVAEGKPSVNAVAGNARPGKT
jgi:hypothetical protein